MKPSVGRIVHFMGCHHLVSGTRQCLAAIVTRVIDESHVDLTVFLPDNTTMLADRAEYGASCVVGTWHWPERES